MCCNRINTDTLMANIFSTGIDKISFDELEHCLKCLSTYSPVYIISDLSKDAVRECVAAYPELFILSKDNGTELLIKKGKKKPNLIFFNSGYTDETIRFLTYTISDFCEINK